MNEQIARVVADAKDWYFGVYVPIIQYAFEASPERHLAESIEKLLASEKVIPPGILVIRDTPTGPVLDQPYVVQPTITGRGRDD